VERLGLYPGSPAIAASMLRPGDRLVACELHEEDAGLLKAAFAGARNVAVHRRDGYEALKAFLPPPEKRALVLIDPPFERTDEFAVLATHLVAAWRRFRTGVFVAWYPVKHRAPVRAFFEAVRLAGARDVVAVEFLRRPALDPARLNGCGLLIINAPFRFALVAEAVLPAFSDLFGEAGGGWAVERVADE
jgi:23S rRNA (adenine2030-N6)-methyltransferase